MERVVRTAVAAMTSGSKHPPPSQNPQAASVPKALSVPGFTIFDETSRKPPAAEQRTQNIEPVYPLAYSKVATATRKLSQEKPVPLTEEALCEQTRLLYVGTGFSSRQAVAPPPSCLTHVTESVFSSTDNDVEILHHMVEHLDTVINITESRKGSYRPLTVRPIEARRSRGPTKWVTRYVDYTSKYGLGFLLNDGCSGVYFNDSTKTALEPSGETFQYIERKRSVLEDEGCTPSKRRGEMTIETYTVESYPEPLKKKVTLLKHFRNYLMQQESNEDDNHNRVQPEKESGVVNQDLVYVKKWVRTKHAILFSLSNRTIQVIFYDQTEILLTPDVAFLTFVDKHRNRLIYDFSDELVGSCNEIEKRLKYTKEIMLQLLSGQRS